MPALSKVFDSSPSHGVDWSERAQPTSHCWFPYPDGNRVPHVICSYATCSVSPSTRQSSWIQCGSCGIIIHNEHLTDCDPLNDFYNHISPCRSSFSDDSLKEDPKNWDQHFWSPISSLKNPCIRCKRKIIFKVRYRSDERDSMNAVHPRRLHGSSLEKAQRKQGFICLWCKQVCHQQCWNSMDPDEEDRKKCDYGQYKLVLPEIFPMESSCFYHRNMIVRPQWLRREAGPSKRFYAGFSHDRNASNSSFAPLLVLVNKLSGGQHGEKIYRELLRSFNPRQVFLLGNNADMEQALDIYASLDDTRICVCGGDGTVGWVISTLTKKYPSMTNPPIGICPLGTGNDLSRVLGWGWHYEEKRLSRTLLEICNARSIALDRWQITLGSLVTSTPEAETRDNQRCFSCLLEHPRFVLDRDPPLYQNYRTPLNTRFSDYLSLGLDAAVVLDFHDQRMQNPSGFTSPFKNKLIYLNVSRRYFKEFALWRSWHLAPYMRLICDGQDVTNSIRQCHTLLLLNISSYGSGTQPWGNVSQCCGQASVTQFQEQSSSDEKIEVIGLDAVQMALIHLNCHGRRIAQCTDVRIELLRSMPVHMDGDPFYLPALTTINVKHAGQVSVLSNRNQ